MKVRVWSQRVQRGDVVIDRGDRREVKAVREDRRAGRSDVVILFKSGPPMRISAGASLEVERR